MKDLCKEVYEISEQARQPELEERFNLHPGKVYRAQIETAVYDGRWSGGFIHVNSQGFALLELRLTEGLFFHAGDPSEKMPFDDLVLRRNELGRLGYFGSISDEAGFERVRERIRREK